jgi:hypothetical protein
VTDLEINDDGLRLKVDQLAEKIRQVDAGLREATLVLHPVHDIEAQAKAALAIIGLELPDAKLQEYAEAISIGEDYDFNLD